MSIFLVSILCFSLLAFLMFVVGVPIAFSMGIAGFVGIWLGWGLDIGLNYLQTTPYRETAHFTMVAVPLFMLMGRFIFHGGLSKALYALAYKWIGRLPGGLAMATCMASAGFGALSGSSSSAVATLAPIVIPEMDRYKYDKKLSLGVLAASGTFAAMIPPSIIFIVYGLITETSIGRLFVAGVIPGILTAFLYICLIAVRCKLNPRLAPLAPRELTTWKERVVAFKEVWHVSLLILVVLGGIYLGVMTVNESAAFGVVASLVIAIACRRMNLTLFRESIKDAASTAALIFIIIIGAFIFNYFLTLTKIPQTTIQLIGQTGLPRYSVLALIIVMYIILGCFMDQLAIQVLTLPFSVPIIVSLGFDPIWFGVIVVKTVEIGLVSPPFGLNVFVMQGISGEPIEKIFGGAIPFLIADFTALMLYIIFPQICLFLPSRMG